MDFVRRLVGSKPKRKALPAAPQQADIALDRSVDEATVLRPVPVFDDEPVEEPVAEEPALSVSGTRGRPDQLTMMGVAPLDARPSTGDTGTHPNAAPLGETQSPEGATVYMQVPDAEPPPRRQVASLSATEGELTGQVFAVLEGTNQLGRAPDSDIVLSSRFVSRVHARLLCEGGKITFSPVSEQLTQVNGQAASECELQDGDEITLGRTTLQIRVEG